MKFLVGFGAIALGFVLIKFFKWIVDHTTRIQFFENYLGYGGTYSAIKLAGVLLVVLGIYVLFGGLGL